jgi:hypothetical protein
MTTAMFMFMFTFMCLTRTATAAAADGDATAFKTFQDLGLLEKSGSDPATEYRIRRPRTPIHILPFIPPKWQEAEDHRV